MASASIKAMIPMTMMGKNFSGSRDSIWAATASASETGKVGERANRHRAVDLNKIKLKTELSVPPPLKAENVLAQRKLP